ncbi:MAG: PA14 domain-containing protein [Anaerolineae bacterium]
MPHGLTGSYYQNASWSGSPAFTRLDKTISFNSNDLRAAFRDNPFSIVWQGLVWAPVDGNYTFVLESDGGSELYLDDELLFRDEGRHQIEENAIKVKLAPGFHQIVVKYFQDVGDRLSSHIYLYWKPPRGGAEIVPGRLLFPNLPREGTFSKDAAIWRLWGLAEGGLRLALLGLGLLVLSKLRLKKVLSRENLVPLAIFALAASLRIIYLIQVENVDPHFYALRAGTDHLTYEAAARGISKGYWPEDRAFYFHPLITYYLYFLHLLFGESLFTIRIAQSLLGAFTCVMIFLVGKKVFNPTVGLIAGLLASTYGVLIFFDGTLLIAPIATLLSVIILWSLLRVAEEQSWGNLIGAGVAFGLSALARANILVFLPFVLFWMLFTFDNSTKRTLLSFAIIVLVTFLVISPVTIRNYIVSDRFILTSDETGVTLFFGNNRYSSGAQDYYAFQYASQRVYSGETSWIGEVLQFVSDEPDRWVKLMLRKIGLFWDNGEIGSNVDYYLEGKAYSSLLRLLILDFQTIAVLGLTGIVLSIRMWKRTLLLYLFIAAYMTTTVAFSVLSRFRVPVVSALIILAAYTIYYVFERARHKEYVPLLRTAGVALATAIAFLYLCALAVAAYPESPLIAAHQLPATLNRIEVSYDEKVKLLGYELDKQIVKPGEFLKITPYFQGLAEMGEDYSVFVHLTEPDGSLIGQMDSLLGVTISPGYPTTDWRVGDLIRDTYMLYVPSTTPAPTLGQIRIGLYLLHSMERLPAFNQQGRRISGDSPLVSQVRIVSGSVSVEEAQTMAHYNLGNRLLLSGYDLDAGDIRPGANLSVTLYWQAQERVEEDYTVFVHLVGGDDQIWAQNDSPPRNGNYPTSVWDTGELIKDEHQLIVDAEAPPGQYRIMVGMYLPETMQRLAAFDEHGERLPEDSILLRTVQIHQRSLKGSGS